MREALSKEEIALLTGYRELILASDYAPLSEDELKRRKRSDQNAVASAAIEGLHGTSMDKALFALFDELRVPDELCRDVLDRYTAHCVKQASTPHAVK